MRIIRIIKEQSSDADGPVNCTGGNCPSLMLTANGDVVIQGKIIAIESRETLNVPAGEEVVLIPRSTFLSLIGQLR